MEALAMSILKLSLAVATSLAIAQPAEWCDSCGEMYQTSELTQEVDYGHGYHGRICEGCEDYWSNQVEWCDSCGEMYAVSELTQEVDYGNGYHGRICGICKNYWM